jgi:hypothetical protein
MPQAIDLSGRLTAAQLMTDLCDARINGRDFVKAVEGVGYKGDGNLDMVVESIVDTFDPDLDTPGFDIDNPPYSIRRQFALFRRFLLARSEYQWPKHAFGFDAWPTVRLLATGIVCAAVFFSLPLAVAFPATIPLAISLMLLAAWLLRREKRETQLDWERQRQRAREFGNPDAWPFINFKDFRSAGSARRLWTGQQRYSHGRKKDILGHSVGHSGSELFFD